MSNLQYGPALDIGFVDKRRASGQTTTNPLATSDNYTDVANMETYLLANGYTAAQLRVMTQNDKVYAMRLSADSAGI